MMIQRIMRLRTTQSGSQMAYEVIPVIDASVFERQMEYFDDNEVPLEDGDYPYEHFEQVAIAASIVAPGEPTPITHYRGVKLKKEYRRYSR